MSDYKTHLVSGGNRLLCSEEAQVVRSAVELHLWTTAGEWKVVSHADNAQSGSYSSYAETTSSCAGLGSNVQYKSRGEGNGVYPVFISDPDGPKDSEVRGFACSEPLREIFP